MLYVCSVNYMTFIVFVAVSLPGELAKYDMLHEAIVHKCIKQVKTVEFENQRQKTWDLQKKLSLKHFSSICVICTSIYAVFFLYNFI